MIYIWILQVADTEKYFDKLAKQHEWGSLSVIPWDIATDSLSYPCNGGGVMARMPIRYLTTREWREREIRYKRNRRSLIEARFKKKGHESRFYVYGLPHEAVEGIGEDAMLELNARYRMRSTRCDYCALLYFTVSKEGRLVFVLRRHKARDVGVAVHEALADMFGVEYDMMFDDGRGGRFLHRLGKELYTEISETSRQGRSRPIRRKPYFDPEQEMLFEGTFVEDGPAAIGAQ